MDCNRDWTYLQSENEFQAPSVSHFTVEECFLKGKQSSQTNEDGMIVTPYFAAVIDGATAKSFFRSTKGPNRPPGYGTCFGGYTRFSEGY